MKTNTYLVLTLISGPATLLLGASLPLAVTVFAAGCVLGLAINDYASPKSVRIRSAV